MKKKARVRATMICCLLAVIYSVFSHRLIYLQVVKASDYTAIANQKQILKQVIPAHRGAIRDANGEILADDMPMRRVIADGSRIKPANLRATAELLAGMLALDEKALLTKLTPDRRYVVIKSKVTEQTAEDLKNKLVEQKLSGIYLEPDAMRIYPNGSLLCHVVGFIDNENNGIQGIEKSMDRYLQGHEGYRYITRDRTGAELVQHRGIEQAPRNGSNVQLTIDLGLQSIVEKELDAAMKKYTPETATVVFMRPKTGEILAMASRPNFDINERADALPEQMKNRAVIDMVEPGSTFKIVTVGAALNEKVVKPDTLIYCENGRWLYAGRPLHDAHPMGMLSVHDVLMRSSNIGSAKLALQLGEDRFYDYIKMLGFGDRTGVDLPGEIRGLLHPPKQWSKLSITRIPMGQEVAATPIQLVMAMGAMANGGKLMMPQIIHSITDENNAPVATYPPVMVRQTVSPEVARQVVAALEDVVSAKGTAKGAAVAGQRVAGKTGTAQKISPHGGYLPGKYVVSFLGFLPADNPELVGLVMLDNATTRAGENYGGLVAAPIFASIAEKAARYYNMPQSAPLPGALGKPLAAKAAVADERD
jgi:cell division protein FtsI/penicillin-binding protein 2